VQASTYDFDTLKSALLVNSPKLKHGELDVQIANKNIDLAYSGYYPNVRLSSNLEHTVKYYRVGIPSFIGEDSLIQSSGKHLSASISADYEIFKFGSTNFAVNAAKFNHISTSSLQCLREKELLLGLLESYSSLRTLNLQLDEYIKIQKIYEELYLISKRLYESGMVAKTDSMEYAQELADIITTISNLKEQKANHISILKQLSGINLSENDELLPLKNSIYTHKNIPFEESTSATRIRALIKQKEEEVKKTKTNFMPSFSLYGKYDMYGGDSSSYRVALDNYEKNGYRFGISFSWPIFNGYASKNELEIKELELLQAKVSYQDAKDEYEKEQFLISSQIRLQHEKLSSIDSSVNSAKELLESSKRLHDAGESNRINLYMDRVDQHKILILQHEANEILSMNYKKDEIIKERESNCVVL
jgi:outer membrane protein TolC